MTNIKHTTTVKKALCFSILALFLLGLGSAWQPLTKKPLIDEDDPKWLVDYIRAIQRHEPKTTEQYTEFANVLNAAVTGIDVDSLSVYQQLHVLFARGFTFSVCASKRKSIACMHRARATVAQIYILLQSPRLDESDRERLRQIRFDRSFNALYSGLNNIQLRWSEDNPDLLKRLGAHTTSTNSTHTM